jgi:DNA-binding GntR family transcriptional regulator
MVEGILFESRMKIAVPPIDEPVKLREKAYANFTERLLARDIRPGQFVSQRELVDITGMPLGAIRELIPRLEADGLIKTVPQRGMQVAHVDVNLIRNAFQFRLILEKAATAEFVCQAPASELERLREAHEGVLSAAINGISAELMARAQATDWNLHYTVIDALGNEIISKAYRVNAIKVLLIRQEYTRMSADLVVPVMREHLSIINAFETRDPALAVNAMADHINNARSRALRM